MKKVYFILVCFAIAFAADFMMIKNAQAQVDPQAAAQLAVAQPAIDAVAAKSEPAVVVVAEPAAPPQWAADIIVAAQKLPIVGPIVSKIILYAGILSSILTALFATFFTILSALSKVMNMAGLQKIADAVQAFKKGKVMYYLAYLSMFNAKKPEKA